MIDLARSCTAIVVAALLFAGCEGNITEPLSPEAEISESVTVSQQSCAVTVENGSIQDAVDAAAAGDNICVDGGTYTEQVVINKDLTLTGINDPTIEAPESPEQFTIPESVGSTWEPVVFAYGGSESGGEVTGEGTVDVSISGFTVDGQDRIDGVRKVGIFFRNVQSTGAIANNTVKNMGVGGTETFGILAYGDADVTIADNTVSGFQRGGIGANGDGGAHPSPTVAITGNTITGVDAPPGGWAPNGIQVGFGATGTVEANTVNMNWFQGADWTASGILIFESDGVAVKRNTLQGNESAISVGAWGWFLPSANNNQIVQNDIDGADFGVVVRAAYGLQTDAFANNNKVTNNTITADEEDEGIIGVVVESVGEEATEFTPTADNNKVINNAISGFEEDVVEDGTDTKVEANEPATP